MGDVCETSADCPTNVADVFAPCVCTSNSEGSNRKVCGPASWELTQGAKNSINTFLDAFIEIVLGNTRYSHLRSINTVPANEEKLKLGCHRMSSTWPLIPRSCGEWPALYNIS